MQQCSASSPSVHRAVQRDLLRFADATEHSCHSSSFIPDLGLPRSAALPFRVYVIRCKPQVLNGPFCYYVGVVAKDELADRFGRHASGSGACFTRENVPEGLVFLWPAAHRALEAYLFAFLLEKLPEEGVLRHVRLGGWTQTLSRRPLPHASHTRLELEWRMVNDRCLTCGQLSHYARDCRLEAQPASAERAAVPDPKAVAPPNAVTSKAALTVQPPAPVVSDDALFDHWWSTKNLVASADGWVPLRAALPALGESRGNPNRFVEAGSDCPGKRWLLQPGNRVPK